MKGVEEQSVRQQQIEGAMSALNDISITLAAHGEETTDRADGGGGFQYDVMNTEA